MNECKTALDNLSTQIVELRTAFKALYSEASEAAKSHNEQLRDINTTLTNHDHQLARRLAAVEEGLKVQGRYQAELHNILKHANEQHAHFANKLMAIEAILVKMAPHILPAVRAYELNNPNLDAQMRAIFSREVRSDKERG